MTAAIDPLVPEPKADLSAWLAVAAGTMGAMMATLDISIVNSSLPVIQGEIGASGSEATWIATAYLVAEIIVIPLAGWLERVLGLRTLLLGAVVLFTGFSILCGLAQDLPTMILGRIGQGFTGGALIPTAMTIIATRLPRRQQPIGTAVFGVVAILGPVVGPLLGGWLTENLSWHYAFFINVPIGALLIALLLLGLPHRGAQLSEFLKADWLGIAGLALGLGGLTVVLEDGHRERWFESALILQLSALSVIGFALLAIGQFTAARPVIRLGLLRNRAFGAVIVVSLVVGAVLYGVAFNIPQFLAGIAGYNALQSGQVVFLSGVPSLIIMFFTPLLIRRVDARLAVMAGLAILSLSAFADTGLTAESSGADFTASQLLRGAGQILTMLFLNQAAISAVGRDNAADAAGLYSVARNLGGSIGLALIASFQDARLWFHARTLEASVSANALVTQDWLAGQGGATDFGRMSAIARLSQQIQRQALVMTYNDMFFVIGVIVLIVTPLALVLKPIDLKQPLAVH